MRYSVRINLADFIDTEDEPFILQYIKNICDELKVELFLKLWYEKDEIESDRVVAFVKRNETVLAEIGTNIHAGRGEGWQDKSWFNICRRTACADEKNYRHYYEYDSHDEILTALVEFRNTVYMSQRLSKDGGRPRPPFIKKPEPYKITIKKVARPNASDEHLQK